MNRPKLVYIVTDAQTAEAFLSRTGQLRYFQQQGYDISLISHPSERLDEVGRKEGISVYGVPLLRKISPGTDLKCLFQLTKILRKVRPTIVNASTPKAGLLGMLAAKMARVPIRIYLLRGLRAETTSGRSRKLMNACEKIAVACAHHVISVSQSLKTKYLEEGLCSQEKIDVLGAGSSNGVLASRFEQDEEKKRLAKNYRRKFAIPSNDCVIGFVGRIAKDKGIDDLVQSFEAIETTSDQKTHLILVGNFEANDPPSPQIIQRITESPDIHVTGYVDNPDDYYGVFDFLAFPSYREGFPNVPLEAAAAGIPTVGYRATGTRDAVVDGETGQLIEIGNTAAFTAAMQKYIEDPVARIQHGTDAHQRVLNEFQPETIFRFWATFYQKMLLQKGCLPVNEQGLKEEKTSCPQQRAA